MLYETMPSKRPDAIDHVVLPIAFVGMVSFLLIMIISGLGCKEVPEPTPTTGPDEVTGVIIGWAYNPGHDVIVKMGVDYYDYLLVYTDLPPAVVKPGYECRVKWTMEKGWDLYYVGDEVSLGFLYNEPEGHFLYKGLK